MFPAILLCLVICSLAHEIVDHHIDNHGLPEPEQLLMEDPPKPPKPPFVPSFHVGVDREWLKNLTFGPPPVSRPKITHVSKNGPPFFMKLDGSESTGFTFKWEQIRGDNEGFTSNKKIFTYKASVSRFYMWELTACTGWNRCHTARVRYRIRNDRPMAIANMYWLGNSLYMDASKSTDDHNAIVKYEWHQKKGDQPGFRSDKKSFVYKTNYKGLFKWRLRVCDAEGRCHGTVIMQDFSTPGLKPSVNAVIEARWYIYLCLPPIFGMTLNAYKSSGFIAKYVWIMESGDDSGLLRYGTRMGYTSITGGLYIWKLLVIGVDNSHHYTKVGHIYGFHPIIVPTFPGNLKAIPKLIPGIDNITLDATSSRGEIYRVHWEEISGDHIGDTSAEPQFSFPYPRSGECTYKLTVFGKDGEMSEEEVSLPDGVLDNWREFIEVEDGDLVEEPDTPPETLAEMWSDFGNATEVDNPPSDNPPE